jgi:hypothetical protein
MVRQAAVERARPTPKSGAADFNDPDRLSYGRLKLASPDFFTSCMGIGQFGKKK